MIGLQVGSAFVLWIAYGLLLWRRSDAVRAYAGKGSRTARAIRAAAMLFGGAAALLAVLVQVQNGGGFTPSGMAGWAWFVVAGAGLVFVHLQTMAAAMLVLLVQEPVTTGVRPASVQQDAKESGNGDA